MRIQPLGGYEAPPPLPDERTATDVKPELYTAEAPVDRRGHPATRLAESLVRAAAEVDAQRRSTPAERIAGLHGLAEEAMALVATLLADGPLDRAADAADAAASVLRRLEVAAEDPAAAERAREAERSMRLAVVEAIVERRTEGLVRGHPLPMSTRRAEVERQLFEVQKAVQRSGGDIGAFRRHAAAIRVELELQDAGPGGAARAQAAYRSVLAEALGAKDPLDDDLSRRVAMLPPSERRAALDLLLDAARFEASLGEPALLGRALRLFTRLDARSLAAVARGVVALHQGDASSAAVAFEAGLEGADPARRLEIRADLASVRLGQIERAPVDDRPPLLARLGLVAEGAEAEAGPHERPVVARIRMAELMGAALAGDGHRAARVRDAIRERYADLPAVVAALDRFDARHQQDGLTAAAEATLAELNRESLGEAIAYQGGGAAIGAAVGTWILPGLGTAGGALLGWGLSLVSLKTRNVVTGRHRIEAAWSTGIDAHDRRETLMNVAFLALDAMELGAPARAAAKLGRAGVEAGLLGRHALSDAGQAALRGSRQRIARALRELNSPALRDLDGFAQLALSQEWVRLSQQLGVKGAKIGAAVQALVLAPMAGQIADALASGDRSSAEALATQALELAGYVALMTAGARALMRFDGTRAGADAAVRAALLRARPTPSAVRLRSPADYAARLDALAAVTDGPYAARIEAAHRAPAFFDPVAGEIHLHRARAGRLGDDALRGVLAHEVAHARIHRLPPDRWFAVVAELTGRPDFDRVKASLQRRQPHLADADDALIVEELLADAARPGSPDAHLLAGPAVRRAGLGRPAPEVDLAALRDGAPVRLDTDGLYVKKSAAEAPAAASNPHLERALATDIFKSGERKAFLALYDRIRSPAVAVEIKGNRATLHLENGGRLRAQEIGHRVDTTYYLEGESLILWETKGSGNWVDLRGNAGAKQIGESLLHAHGNAKLEAYGRAIPLGEFLLGTPLGSSERSRVNIICDCVSGRDEAYLAAVIDTSAVPAKLVDYHPVERTDLDRAGLSGLNGARLEDRYQTLLRSGRKALRGRVPIAKIRPEDRVVLIPVRGSLDVR